jgi:hypothetical protein
MSAPAPVAAVKTATVVSLHSHSIAHRYQSHKGSDDGAGTKRPRVGIIVCGAVPVMKAWTSIPGCQRSSRKRDKC